MSTAPPWPSVSTGLRDAPVVMLSNSLMSNLSMWDPQIDALSGQVPGAALRHARPWRLCRAAEGPYTMEMLGEDAVALMDALGLESVHFCGLSMGGMIGQYLGANHGQRLKSLTLCDTACVMPPKSMWDDRIQTARDGGTGAAEQPTLERWFTAPFRADWQPGDRQGGRDDSLDPSGRFCRLLCVAIRDMDQTQALSKITTDTLIIVGEDDPGTPVSAAEVLNEHIAGSKLVVIPEFRTPLQYGTPGSLQSSVLLEFLDAL